MTGQSIGSIDPPPPHERSLHVQISSALIVNVAWIEAVSRRAPQVCVVLRNAPCRRGELSYVKNRLSANDPTSMSYQSRCSKFSVAASFSTSPSLCLENRCCIDRLRSQFNGVIHGVILRSGIPAGLMPLGSPAPGLAQACLPSPSLPSGSGVPPEWRSARSALQSPLGLQNVQSTCRPRSLAWHPASRWV